MSAESNGSSHKRSSDAFAYKNRNQRGDPFMAAIKAAAKNGSSSEHFNALLGARQKNTEPVTDISYSGLEFVIVIMTNFEGTRASGTGNWVAMSAGDSTLADVAANVSNLNSNNIFKELLNYSYSLSSEI
jgi:hypothetical protein